VRDIVRCLRDRVIYLYDQAYPRATKVGAERWRMLLTGKPHVADWTKGDWRTALRVLDRKVGRPRLPDNQDNKELGL